MESLPLDIELAAAHSFLARNRGVSIRVIRIISGGITSAAQLDS
jgi:hypothetical protein